MKMPRLGGSYVAAGAFSKKTVRSVGYARPPLGVPADLQSAVKKCPNLFMLWGYVIPSPQAIAGISLG